MGNTGSPMSTPPTIDPNGSVGELVVAAPAAARVLSRHGIDFCCGGHQNFAEVCAAGGLDAAAILDEIRREAPPADQPDWPSMTVYAICNTIEERYHRPLHAELPRVQVLMAKVVGAHGEKYPALGEMQRWVDGLARELKQHLQKEEKILFPLIRQTGTAPLPPVHVMRFEHDEAGNALKAIRRIADDYVPPPDACASFTELYRSLEALEHELFEHIHVENNILFPRILPTQDFESEETSF
jgi:regulator of cell morphogenesis and NO signaling